MSVQNIRTCNIFEARAAYEAEKAVSNPIETEKPSIFSPQNERMNTVAHRGYSSVAPENTLPAFLLAKESGYDTIECDIEWTKDNIPVILHDSTINRTARKQNGGKLFFPKKCSDLTYDELLKYDFGSWYSEEFKGTKIPSFNEVLNCGKENDLKLYIELKESNGFNKERAKLLAESVKKAGLEDKVTWISFNKNYLKLMTEEMPESRIGYLSYTSPKDKTIDTLEDLRTGKNEVFLDVRANAMSEKASQLLKDSGFNFEAWTVNGKDNLSNLDGLNCKAITTDSLSDFDVVMHTRGFIA